MRVATYEDRPDGIVGLKLLLLSLSKWCPGLGVDVFFPDAPVAFRRWIEPFPDITLHSDREHGGSGYNLKPELLIHLLNDGADQARWIDSDVIVTRDFREW